MGRPGLPIHVIKRAETILMGRHLQKYGVMFGTLVLILSACLPGRGDFAVAYLVTERNGGDIWVTRGDETRQITFTDGQVYDYVAAPDGQSFIFSQNNSSGGLDLWITPQERRLLDCGADWCYEPVFSPDGRILAYSRREYSSQSPGSVVPRIWTLNLTSGQTTPLLRDVFVAGQVPFWSPDGAKLAFYDSQVGGLRIVTLASGESQILASGAVGGSWSGDGKQLAFVDFAEAGVGEAVFGLYLADADTREVHPLNNIEKTGVEYSVPAWSSDGAWLAVGWRYPGGPPGQQLKLINPWSGEEQPITNDLTYSHTAYRWSADGARLVFQRVKLGSSDARPEVWVWERANGELQLLAENAALPQFLP